MPITMTKKPEPEIPTWEPGSWRFKLVEITVKLATEYQKPTETYPAAKLVWVDQDGDKFHDSFVRIPKDFGLNDKAKFVNRLSALAGRQLTDDDAENLEIDLGKGIESWDDLERELAKGAEIPMTVKFQGEPLIGRSAQLLLTKTDDGYNRCAATGASPMPREDGSGKTKKSKAAPAAADENEPASPF